MRLVLLVLLLAGCAEPEVARLDAEVAAAQAQ